MLRLAGHLALARGGEAVDNPLGWLDSLEEEALQFWLGFAQVEPFGRTFERHALHMTMLDRLFATQVSGKYKINDPSAFMPSEYYKPPKKKQSNKALYNQCMSFVKAYSK